MPEYVLGHGLKGERARLALMSALLDPMHRRYIDALDVVRPGARTLEVGCGNGSISAWLAEQVSPGGTAVAVDLDLSLIDVRAPNLELRGADIVAGPVERGAFDLVTGRAVLHHVADAEAAMANLVASLRPCGAILLIEPDFLPVSVAEPPEVRAFWNGWLAWSRERGIDYTIGRRLAPRLASLETITELRNELIRSGKLDDALVDSFLAHCVDSNWWTQTIAFTAIHGRAPAA